MVFGMVRYLVWYGIWYDIVFGILYGILYGEISDGSDYKIGDIRFTLVITSHFSLYP